MTTILLLSTIPLLIALLAARRSPSTALVGLHIPGRLNALGFVWQRRVSHWQRCASRSTFEKICDDLRVIVIELPK